MTKDFHGCGVRQAGPNVVPWEKPVTTGCGRRRWNKQR
jgi:hypothetical protein